MELLSSVELCAGGGGQALGLEKAGFFHEATVEIEAAACETLRLNRPEWNVIEGDLKAFDGSKYHGVDLVAGGVPCPPFSIAGKQLGADDDRDLFPEALRVVDEARPNAVMLENVRGFSSKKFDGYRSSLLRELERMGYTADWRLLNASDYFVPQLRPRFILVGLKSKYAEYFRWPEPSSTKLSVGETLRDLMSANGWIGADAWALRANGVGPTVVGGSKKHGGPDLGPTRARQQWAELGVDGLGIANQAPERDFPVDGNPKLTVRMVARIQGFPDEWKFSGKKTSSYRQVGNAFPPPVASALGASICAAVRKESNVIAPSDRLTGLPLLELMK